MTPPLSLADVRAAADVVYGTPQQPSSVLRTPLLEWRRPNGRRLWFKAENLQPIGAFKIRGATHMIRRLPAGTAGVVAHSSGNHAQAVARAAKEAGLPAVVVMPSDAPGLKRARTEADGAEVLTVGPDSAERAERADAEVAARPGWVLVPPFDHPHIAAGQGTAALELHEQLGAHRPTRFYCPTSGGGLLAGCSTVLKGLRPEMEVVAVEPEAGDDTRRSLAAGTRVSVPPPATLADGLRVRTPGAFTFEVLKHTVDRASVVTDGQLMEGMAWALTHLRLVLEPSGAAALAAALAEQAEDAVVLLSGGNLEPRLLAEVAALAAQN